MGLQRQEIENGRGKLPPPAPLPKQPAAQDSAAARFFEAKPGFANFYFNKLERERLWNAFHKQSDFSSATGSWTIDAELYSNKKRVPARFTLADEKDADGKNARAVVQLSLS